MNTLLYEMTREEIRRVAPGAVALLPTASIEQHGPHLSVSTDALLCETVATRAAQQVAEQVRVVVAPTLCYGNSQHHYPFPGVLSMNSDTYQAALTEIADGLVRSGFHKIVILNGHGGNSAPNTVAGLDVVNRLGLPATVATADYWGLAQAALTESNRIAGMRMPGHAGHFETSMVLALRPDWVDRHVLAGLPALPEDAGVPYDAAAGAIIQAHGVWATGPGYTDHPATANPDDGQAYLEIIVGRVAAFLRAFAG